ncbi:hypothetical protein ACH42_06095 [Endozoicomonas sp. (ex Bugula neritina AB1)]|nr:hypothetical protein ACH42_06095 [Endozoicomonas sp. (ex Bugula neritina AB1)]
MMAIKNHYFSQSPLAVAGYRMMSFGKAVLFSAAVVVFCSTTVIAGTSDSKTGTGIQPSPVANGVYDLLTDEQLEGPSVDPLQADIEATEGTKLWHDYSISETDTIDQIFLSEGLSQNDLRTLLNTAAGIEFLTDLSQTKELRYQLDSSSRLTALDVVLKSNERLRFERDRSNGNAEFTIGVIEESVSSEMKRISGDIQNSFYKSAKAVGLSVSTIQQFANIFQWQIDFNRDLHNGDRFEILLKESSSDDKQIIAARLYQKHKTLSAIRYTDGQYFTEEGKQLGRAFERNPLGDGYKVSSSFNLTRKHPVTGKVQPHKGTDWAVPIGTKVKASADGVVSKAVQNHEAAGNYIEVRHGRRYITRYLHLDSLNVKAGDKVAKGQMIGFSGNTGLSTGPHLHYELYVNGRPVDAMKARLPDGKTLQGTELSQFKDKTSSIVAVLNSYGSPILLARQK